MYTTHYHSRGKFQVTVNARGAESFNRGGYDYVALPSGTEYSITLSNNYGARCDASVTIDNERVGGWQLDPYDSITIERPGDTQRKFVFVSETSRIARQTGAVVGAQENGLIRVEFRPAKYCQHCLGGGATVMASDQSTMAAPRSRMATAKSASRSGSQESLAAPSARFSAMASPSLQSGVTVLGRESSQRFDRVMPLRDDEIDWSLVTTITLRLVAKTREDYTSLRSRSPPRIDEYY